MLSIIEVFDSNVPNIDNGKIWIDINKLWGMTNLENEASYFVVDDKFKNPKLSSWNFKSRFALLKSLKDLINQKKTAQIYSLWTFISNCTLGYF